MSDKPQNPYVAGRALHEEEVFFGRQDIIDWVHSELKNPSTNALVLYGQRRIGKTSLLLKLQRHLPSADYFPIYFDLQDQAERPLGEVLYDLADTAAELIDIELEIEKFDDRGNAFRRSFMPFLYSQIGEKRRPVFLFDEFDVLDVVAEIELPQTAAARSLFPLIRRLMNEDPKPVFVFVVGRRADDLALDFMATFKASLVREIWVLDKKSSKDIILQADKNGTLKMSPEAVEYIYQLCNGHPYLTQLLCQRIWERAYSSNPPITPAIGVAEVDAAITDTLETGDHALSWLWSGLGPAEKIYASALADISTGEEIISEERVIRVITGLAFRLRTKEVELAPRDLVKRRVLESSGEKEYKFAIELFRRWVSLRRPLREVKDELDKLEPLAEANFQVGIAHYHRNEYEKAIRNFRDALAINPHHFQSQLNLGEALLKLNRTDEAVVEFERAYERDRDDSKWPLVRGLLAQARSRFQSGDEEGSLESLDRVLNLSPNDREAQELQVEIWRSRGDKAVQQNDLDFALIAYSKAKASDKIFEVEQLKQKQRLEELKSQIQSYIQSENWDQVIELSEKIKIEFSEDTSWQEIYDRAHEQKTFARSYKQAIDRLGAKEPEKAVPLLAQILGKQPDYKNAPRLIVQAITGRDFSELEAELEDSQNRVKQLEKENRSILTRKLLYIPGIILGLLIGWFVIGWWLWPVQWQNVNPDSLSRESKIEYLQMALESFQTNGDSEKVLHHYDALGSDAHIILLEVERNNPGNVNSETFTAFESLLNSRTFGEVEASPGLVESLRPYLPWFIALFLLIISIWVFVYLRNRSRYLARASKELAERIWPLDSYGTQTPIGNLQPRGVFAAEYRLGDDLFDDSFSIDSPAGEFLGECGVAIAETIGVGEPKKVTAFEIWLFDKHDIRTVTVILVSNHAYQDRALMDRLASKGELVRFDPSVVTVLETETLHVEARVVEFQYGSGALPADSYFEHLFLEISVWGKE